jgi:hypothetical protein
MLLRRVGGAKVKLLPEAANQPGGGKGVALKLAEKLLAGQPLL